MARRSPGGKNAFECLLTEGAIREMMRRACQRETTAEFLSHHDINHTKTLWPNITRESSRWPGSQR